MHPADFAAMSSPLRNPQLSRRWRPPPLKRERRPGRGGASELFHGTRPIYYDTTGAQRKPGDARLRFLATNGRVTGVSLPLPSSRPMRGSDA